MRARNIILTIAAAILIAAPAAVFAQTGPGPGDGSGSGGAWGGGQGPHGGGQGRFGNAEGGDGLRFFERMLPRVAEELGLSDEQLSQIQAIVDAARQTIEEQGHSPSSFGPNGRPIARPTRTQLSSTRAPSEQHAAAQHRYPDRAGGCRRAGQGRCLRGSDPRTTPTARGDARQIWPEELPPQWRASFIQLTLPSSLLRGGRKVAARLFVGEHP